MNTEKPSTANLLKANFTVLRELQQTAFNGAVNAESNLIKQAWLEELSRVNRELMAAIDFEAALAK